MKEIPVKRGTEVFKIIVDNDVFFKLTGKDLAIVKLDNRSPIPCIWDGKKYLPLSRFVMNAQKLQKVKYKSDNLMDCRKDNFHVRGEMIQEKCSKESEDIESKTNLNFINPYTMGRKQNIILKYMIDKGEEVSVNEISAILKQSNKLVHNSVRRLEGKKLVVKTGRGTYIYNPPEKREDVEVKEKKHWYDEIGKKPASEYAKMANDRLYFHSKDEDLYKFVKGYLVIKEILPSFSFDEYLLKVSKK